MTSAERVLRSAEARVRTGGYNGFSFRDIAQDTGLTNAGVHHHFPTKADLVKRLAETYTDRFVRALRDCAPDARVQRLRALFSESLRQDGQMCLCGVLASEAGGLPEPVVRTVRAFFDDLRVLLRDSFVDDPSPDARALGVLAHLEGAALLATVEDDPSVFDEATQLLG